jgi:malate dehydrogenase (oxaloacetate-decarboxylating)(NADP+)
MLGIPVENIWVTDIKGLVYEGRVEDMDEIKGRYAKQHRCAHARGSHRGRRRLPRAVGRWRPQAGDGGEDGAGAVDHGAGQPQSGNPAGRRQGVRNDAIIATGRSDYPNQVNNVLCFPFIFRGALDVGATTITEAMKLAAVKAISELARVEQSEVAVKAYGEKHANFGPEYLIPNPFDPRLIGKIAPAVAEAAMASGVATRPIKDLEAYRESLDEFVYHFGLIMKPVFSQAKQAPRRIVFAEGEDDRVLRAMQVIVDEGIAKPILIGHSGRHRPQARGR